MTDSVYLFADFSVNTLIGDVPLSIELLNNSSEGLYYWDFDDGKHLMILIQYMNMNQLDHIILSLQLIDDHLCEDEKSINIEAQGFNLSINNWEQMFNDSVQMETV